jgi:hypothetical protein
MRSLGSNLDFAHDDDLRLGPHSRLLVCPHRLHLSQSLLPRSTHALPFPAALLSLRAGRLRVQAMAIWDRVRRKDLGTA